MAKQALIEQRPWLLASITAAMAFYFLRDNPVGEGTWGILAKGASVGLLAAYALARVPRGRRGIDGAILVLALLLAAAGDMAIEIDFMVGGAFFTAAHCVAVVLYLRNRRERSSPSQRMLGLALLIATPVVSYFLSEQVNVAIYASFLGAMAAAAWMSRYPRYRVGTRGAVCNQRLADFLKVRQLRSRRAARSTDLAAVLRRAGHDRGRDCAVPAR